ncbi:MAG: RrF2 family transcriptional regulator [Eubacteriales bacterium]|nr:RrF2 family transcriptional regulator [Eubacteriales bacterium]
MIVSTRGRYALRVLLDLAEHRSAAYIPMKDVTARQGISQKYIEQIMPVLVKAGFVEGVHGKGGGYRLARAPEDCPVGEILRLTEGDLAPVACLSCGAAPCERSADCRTIGMWTRFNEITNEYFDAISLADLLRQ